MSGYGIGIKTYILQYFKGEPSDLQFALKCSETDGGEKGCMDVCRSKHMPAHRNCGAGVWMLAVRVLQLFHMGPVLLGNVQSGTRRGVPQEGSQQR